MARSGAAPRLRVLDPSGPGWLGCLASRLGRPPPRPPWRLLAGNWVGASELAIPRLPEQQQPPAT